VDTPCPRTPNQEDAVMPVHGLFKFAAGFFSNLASGFLKSSRSHNGSRFFFTFCSE